MSGDHLYISAQAPLPITVESLSEAVLGRWPEINVYAPGEGGDREVGYGDSFEATDLEELLAERGVGRLVVTGAQTDQCIRSTIHGGFARGYDVLLVGDAHTTEDLTEWGAPTPDKVIAHTNMY